jgi:cytochrome P450
MATRPSAPSEIIDPAYFAAHGYPYDEFARLSDEAPVAWCEAPGFEPFWAVTDHADLVWISKQPEIFENAPRQFIAPKSQLGELELTEVAHQLLNMDPPDRRQLLLPVSANYSCRCWVSSFLFLNPTEGHRR